MLWHIEIETVHTAKFVNKTESMPTYIFHLFGYTLVCVMFEVRMMLGMSVRFGVRMMFVVCVRFGVRKMFVVRMMLGVSVMLRVSVMFRVSVGLRVSVRLGVSVRFGVRMMLGVSVIWLSFQFCLQDKCTTLSFLIGQTENSCSHYVTPV